MKFCFFEFEVKFEFFGLVGYDFFFRAILHTLPTIKRIALNDVMTVAKKKSGEKAINFDDRKSFSITITGSRGQLVPSLSGLFVHFQLKACLPYLLACQLLPLQPILYKPTSVGLICTTEILSLVEMSLSGLFFS